MRPIKELLILLRDWYKENYNKKEGVIKGLCFGTLTLHEDGIISFDEQTKANVYIRRYAPKYLPISPYYWPRTEEGVQQRIDWLNEQINKQ